MVHTAEGELFRGAITRAATSCGWPCILIRERQLYKLAAKQLHIPDVKLRFRVTEMGHAVGSPWSVDENSLRSPRGFLWPATARSQLASPQKEMSDSRRSEVVVRSVPSDLGRYRDGQIF